ncbi:MAG: DUF4091 domain-containing protein [Victivallales bacterium]|nr:DUF4091 domain-containing protein [Victivallales bacterium]
MTTKIPRLFCLVCILAISVIAEPLIVSEWTPSNKNATSSNDGILSVRGNGEDCIYWLSPQKTFTPGTAYCISFLAKGDDASGNTLVSGPLCTNVDVGIPPAQWKRYSNIFAAPVTPKGENTRIRLGQWHLKGSASFSDLTIAPVMPVFLESNGIVLGDGERISTNEYLFQPFFNSPSRNFSRPLHKNNAIFNTSRWVFNDRLYIIYKFQLNGRKQLSGRVQASVHYHVGGVLKAEVSKDETQWIQIGTLDKKGLLDAQVPESFFPADTVFLKLSATTSESGDIRDAAPGSFQIGQLSYKATLTGPPVEITGTTSFFELPVQDDSLAVKVKDLGDAMPGDKSHVTLSVKNLKDSTLKLTPHIVLSLANSDIRLESNASSLTLKPQQEQEVTIPYSITDVGDWRMVIFLTESYSLATTINIPDYLRQDYGELLADEGKVAIWSTSSGWKIPRNRKPPQKRGTALKISAALNEAEAAQLVLTPHDALTNLTATATALNGPNGAVLPASAVEILNVYYHEVKIQSDSSSIKGFWPDALPPIKPGFSISANKTQPLWVRVTIPTNAVPGIYHGSINLKADGWQTSIPLEIEAYPFILPDKMTVKTAFGFYDSITWRYHGAKKIEDKRKILEMYWEHLGKHHISPYNPAPLDPCSIKLLGNNNQWNGGTRIKDAPKTGEYALEIVDNSTTGQQCATYNEPILLQNGSYAFSFDAKTATPNQQFMVTISSMDDQKQWISRNNKDFVFTGDVNWKSFSGEFKITNPLTKYIGITLRPTCWTEKMELTGTTTFANFSLRHIESDKSIVDVSSFKPADYHDFNILFNWDAWDKAVEHAFKTYHFDGMRFPLQGLGGGTFHSRNAPKLFGFTEGTPEYDHLIKIYFKGVEEHLAEKGLLGSAYIYWFDEPDKKDYEFVMNGFSKIKKYAPRLRRLLTEQVEPELIGGPNLWCPLTPAVTKESVAERHAAGDEYWWYVCTGPKAPYATLFIDHPGTELRVWLWQSWDFGIDGILVWCSNLWHSATAYPDSLQNPYEDPMGWVTGYDVPKGVRNPWGNGDGRFLYPPESLQNGPQDTVSFDKPVDSIRLEMLRDGIEDYEYFVMLKRLLSQKADKLPPEKKAAYEDLLKVPADVSTTLTEFTRAPEPLELHRAKLAKAIAEVIAIP